MDEPPRPVGDESRWLPALAILAVVGLLAVLPTHVRALPIWVSYVAAFAVVVPIAVVTLATASVDLWC